MPNGKIIFRFIVGIFLMLSLPLYFFLEIIEKVIVMDFRVGAGLFAVWLILFIFGFLILPKPILSSGRNKRRNR